MEAEMAGARRAAIEVDSFFLVAEGRMDPLLFSCLLMFAATMEAEMAGGQRKAIEAEAIVSFILEL